MRDKPLFPLKIFYDGACYVCSAEMSLYRGKDHGDRLVFVDISDPGFNPREHGISPDDLMFQLHAIDRRGTVYRGVDAFRAVWLAFPGSSWYGFLAALVSFPVVKPISAMLYRIFARIRRFLPTRRAAVCRIGRRPPR